MQVHNGLNSFLNVIKNLENNQSKEEAWLNYYKEYREIFDTIFANLYMTDIEKKKQYIVPHIDFYSLAEQANKSSQVIDQAEVTEVLKKAADYFKFTKEFDVYMLVGFGHIDGTALPAASRPFLYLGLERLSNIDIERLIQHEFNHLVRFDSLLEDNLTVGQLIIAEGLATLTPLIMNKMDFSHSNLQKMLFLDDQQYNLLKENIHLIEQDIKLDFEKNITPSLMEKYFMLNENLKFGKSGYFFGMQVLLTLLKNGWELKDLTLLNSNLIWNEYQKLRY
ncbi:DUF2268 domain-containing protein [Mesobacillus subterraneus]|uniref:DUF2268 domain-containing putative Zn-dependent protease n=1 Tax=Mesobacillus subterraneus TaxID=285983 RepID=UPI00203B8FD2|nr:DUF2268 domain-containing putative Zn-dependent protease [Mesobacillus subterraneus]MCM3667236.1 DUF2268 domain-containing protein [Mesobacillus subterraneus]MCM3686169.1 DUF2268 domain-containing protein [Mesobacillus subterraneus]